LLLLAYGCDNTGVCERDACDARCVEACATDPELSFCAQTALCASVDAGTDGGRDGGADAGDAQVAEDGGGACECPASTPYCHPSAGCVTCLESAHCESASASRCEDHVCVACMTDEECVG